MNNINLSFTKQQTPQVCIRASSVELIVLVSRKIFNLTEFPYFLQRLFVAVPLIELGEVIHQPYFPFPVRLQDSFRASVQGPNKTIMPLHRKLPIKAAELERINVLEHSICKKPELVAVRLEWALEQAEKHRLAQKEIPQFKKAAKIPPIPFAEANGYEDCGVAFDIGRRLAMEDHWIKGENYSAVFDGHGPLCLTKDNNKRGIHEELSPGTRAAKHAADTLPSVIAKMKALFSDESDLSIFNAFSLAFVKVGRAYTGLGGTTANFAWRKGSHLWVANAGDSRAIAITSKRNVQLSRDAKFDSAYFRDLVKQRGGEIVFEDAAFRVDGSLAMASALGDHNLLGHISQLPTIVDWEIPQDEECYLLQATDGLFDVASTDQVGDYVRRRLKDHIPLYQIAQELIAIVLEVIPKQADNTTVFIRRL